MSVIVARPPYAGGSRIQDLSNRAYLFLARVAGRVLGRSRDVTSIYVRRSLAAGEVDFGRSDIDYTILIRAALDGTDETHRLADLCRKGAALRRAIPVLGEGAVFTKAEHEWWGAVDPYRHNLSARAAILVFGEPVETGNFPIDEASSVRRFVFWFDTYLSRAIRKADRRNLRKYALELWNAWSCVTGLAPQPFVTRRATETAWRSRDGTAFPVAFGRDVVLTAGVCFELAERLHRTLTRPLARLAAPLVFRAVLWPRFEERTFVVLPGPHSPPPPEARAKDSLICTPEVLDLCVHYLNPMMYWSLASEAKDLGIAAPSPREFVQAGRFWLDPCRARGPGFGYHPHDVITRYWVMSHVATQLAAGLLPEQPDAQEARAYLQRMPSIMDYYRDWYRKIYRMGVDARQMLDGLRLP